MAALTGEPWVSGPDEHFCVFVVPAVPPLNLSSAADQGTSSWAGWYGSTARLARP